MLYTDILERESWRVMEDDSKKREIWKAGGQLCKGFTDKEAGAAANGRVIARVFTRDACEGVVWRGTVQKFSRGSGGLYPSFSEAEKVRVDIKHVIVSY